MRKFAVREKMTTKSFMIQGTGSNVGKSMLVASLCRYFTNQGLKVRPFKPQNMSNNAAVTPDGGEIGRAQALQALACKTAPSIHMNPILLKPEGETGSQLIIQGKRRGSYKAKEFYKLKKDLMAPVLDSFEHLKAQADLIIVEGAGSASEINLREHDIANMGFALRANVPVYLAADIDRGGILAALVGTHALLPQNERDLIKGYIINKFRGDPALFHSAQTLITKKTNWPSLGICPWFPKAHTLPAEDSQDLQSTKKANKAQIKIAVPLLPRIANFDDLDPLSAEPTIDVQFIKPGTPLPQDADLIILPGSKATIADLRFLYAQGWDIDIKAHMRAGGAILGLCGGYQMLGRSIKDPQKIESSCEEINGLNLLDVETTLEPIKTLTQTTANFEGETLTAYEMHMGTTKGPDCNNPLFMKNNQPEGAQTPSGQIMGTYLHGLFQEDGFRTAFLQKIQADHQSTLAYQDQIDTTLNELADHLETHLNIDKFIAQNN